MEAGSDPQQGLALNERWANLKPRVIRPLGTWSLQLVWVSTDVHF